MLLGDAYVQLDELDKAIKAYEHVATANNDLISPMALKKQGIVYLEKGDKKAAKKVFEKIRDNYAQSAEAQDIEKYIATAE